MIKCLLPSGSLDFSQELEELRAAASDGNMRIMTDTLTLQERGGRRSGGEACHRGLALRMHRPCILTPEAPSFLLESQTLDPKPL